MVKPGCRKWTAAVASLQGRLHGGANTAVMHMLREIGSEEAVSAWLDQALARTWCERAGQSKWFRMSDAMAKQMRERKGLHPNVDFYSASLYHALGIDAELYTPLFAASRVAGWTAHVLEQRADNRLIRPRAEYIGPEPRPYVPLSQR